MKKLVVLLIVSTLAFGIFAGCSKEETAQYAKIKAELDTTQPGDIIETKQGSFLVIENRTEDGTIVRSFSGGIGGKESDNSLIHRISKIYYMDNDDYCEAIKRAMSSYLPHRRVDR